MASPEELTPLLPDTLPEDFSEWDGEAAPEPAPSPTNEWEAWEATHSFGEPKSPRGQSTDRISNAAPTTETPRASGPSPSAPAFVEEKKHFIEWDGETSPTPKPVDLSEWEAWEAAHSFGKTPAPAKPPADRNGSISPVAEGSRVSISSPTAPYPARQEPATRPLNGTNGSSGHAPTKPEATRSAKQVAVAPTLAKTAVLKPSEPATVSPSPDNQALFQQFSPKAAEVTEKPKTAKKKWMIVAPVSAAVVLLAVAFASPLLRHNAKPAEKAPVQPAPQASETQPVADTSNAPDNAPATPAQPAPTTTTQPTAAGPSTNDPNAVKPAPGLTKKQAKLMNDQLTAPTVIPQGGQGAENAPPPVNFASNVADGLGGPSANDGVLSGRTQPSVKVVSSRPFAISSGVATGMLIRQTPPVYPAIAKAAGVSGTVVVHATISKNGTIKDAQVVSGSPMLQQAALDAVRNWRYKPYKLSNEPVEVDTTISIVFSPSK